MLAAFTAGLLLITISEIGDKSFFIAAILAMRHARRFVFAGAVLALAVMTILSVMMGQVATLLPKQYIHSMAIALFLGFGFKLLYEASRMANGCALSEEQEAIEAVEQCEAKLPKQKTGLTIMVEAFTLTFLAEWGDTTQISTILLAASNNPYGVAVGATLGHTICAAIAVICGRLVAGRVSERMVTGLGGVLFLIFGGVAIVGGT